MTKEQNLININNQKRAEEFLKSLGAGKSIYQLDAELDMEEEDEPN